MSRPLLGAALAVSLLAAAAVADDSKSQENRTIKGQLSKVDPSAHLILVTEYGSKKPKTWHFKLHESTQFVFHSETGKKEMKRKEAYSNKAFKEGAAVAVVVDKADKALEVRVGPPKRGR